MGQQVSVETFTSTKDSDGNKYWTSFDPYPFKVGSKKLVYMGILNGDGPLKGQKCVVKTVRNGAITRRDWMLESNRSKVARDMANSYNKVVTRDERKISFNCPIMAEIDTMSDCLCINDILGKPKKKWTDSEFVSIELYLRGHFDEFEYGWVSPEELIDTEAFSHFTWCQSEGRILVSNLQGVKTSNAYHFTGPVIHSEDMTYGTSDLGQKGIKGFFKLHQCNRICKNWPRLGDGADLRGWGEYIVIGEKNPTAPPLPSAYSFSPPPYTERDGMPYLTEIPEETETDENQLHGISHNTQNDIQMQRNMQRIPAPQFQQTAYHQRGSQWQNSNGQGFCLDWHEEFINQSMNFDPSCCHDNPVLQDEMFGRQLMWIVKQMSYAVYAAPPPPYFTRAQPRREITQHDFTDRSSAREKKRNLEYDDDFLLPPPYAEESVDPELEYVTYL
ncbi:alpha-protein kinase 1-like [Mercenaria mercenaria]|uniref:alpha-protein kinase 1-like n=1 Tax=Mercenaria mercenaria TaxID=6596 RepID=UPI00234EBC90|nr:alpha-protein kinase 1-like [Mercenaria mercenaria]XP_053401768.1 alpha-protein kinase 1-like [Mercenaria mercenaria]